MKSPGAHRNLLRVVNQNAAASETVHDVAQECNLEQFGYVQILSLLVNNNFLEMNRAKICNTIGRCKIE
ncbi:hypothetical protein AFLA_002506 [Aspergillus flavus NRRL3357]|nr:hypothetical protein AFLA_002506 [Aspergillus flavus NRRL3357]